MGDYNGLAARNGQRHITDVMFSAVVHQSMTATSQCVVIKRERFADDDPSEQETGGTGKGSAGGWWGEPRGKGTTQ
jgi:hypothetical protein